MKKIILCLLSVSFAMMTGCNNSKKNSSGSGPSIEAQADSLSKLVINIHNEGMAGCMKIDELKPVLQLALDSLNKLPKQEASPAEKLAMQYTGALQQLQVAYDDMYSWMENMYIGADEDAPEVKLKKLMAEEAKAKSVNEAISNSLRKADSLLTGKR